MKKFVLLLLIIGIGMVGFAVENTPLEAAKPAAPPLDYNGMRFGVGALVSMDSPLLVGNKKGMELGDRFTGKVAVAINDFVFGVPMQFDWIWENKSHVGVGIKLDLDVAYVPAVDYESVFNEIKKSGEKLISGEVQNSNLEHIVRAELAPMLTAKFTFFKFGIGPGLILDMNCSQLDDARKAVAGTPNSDHDVAFGMKRVGLDESRTVESLNGWESIAFYGLDLDLDLRMTLDFELGKHLSVGGIFKFRFHSDMQNWKQGADAKTNFAAVFNPEKYQGLIGFRFLYFL